MWFLRGTGCATLGVGSDPDQLFERFGRHGVVHEETGHPPPRNVRCFSGASKEVSSVAKKNVIVVLLVDGFGLLSFTFVDFDYDASARKLVAELVCHSGLSRLPPPRCCAVH